MTPASRLAAAETNAATARDQLSRDLAELQARLDPKLLARSAVDEAREVGLAGVDTARRNPAAVAGGAAVLALLLFRRPIARLFRSKPRVYATAKSPDAPASPLLIQHEG